jgi:hypothetical protein
MTPEVARKVLPLVNVKQNNERLEHYVDWRISYLHTQLEQCQTVDEMKMIQGQIKEVRRLLTLKDEANQAAREAH